jgi:hypothetical protein
MKIVEKNLLDNNYNASFQAIKSEITQKFQQEIKDLEFKRQEKQKRLNQALQDINVNSALNGRMNARNHQEILSEYQNKIKHLNEILLNKVRTKRLFNSSYRTWISKT